MRAIRWAAAAIVLCAVTGISSNAWADKPRKVILVIADRLTIEDLIRANRPNISRLLEGGAIGLVSPSALGRKSPEAVFASAATGIFFKGFSDLNEAYSAEEVVPEEQSTAAEVYERRMGRPAKGQVLLITAGKIERAIDEGRLRLKLGTLGGALRRNGLKTAVFGNSDILETRSRPAVCMAIDETGQAAFGDVSSAMLRSGSGPTGLITDVQRMVRAALSILNRAALVAIDFGDTARLDIMRPTLTAEAYEQYKRQAISDLDKLLAGLMPAAHHGEANLILASFVPPGGEKWFRLPALIIYGKDIPYGLLTSATTRTPGLVAGVDIAPSILRMIGVEIPYEMEGEPIRSIAERRPAERTEHLMGIISRNAAVQLPLVGIACGIGMMAVIIAVGFAAFGAKPSRGMRAVIMWCIVFGLCFPIASLSLGRIGMLFPIAYALLVIGAMAVFSAVVILCSALIGRRSDTGASELSVMPVILIAGLTAAVVTVDAFTSGALARYSAIPTFGYRYYGVGNEYLGYMIGCICLLAIWFAGEKREQGGLTHPGVPRWAYLLVFAISTLAIGLPGLGTNAGEALTAVVTFGLLYLALMRGRFQARHFFGLVAAGILLLVAFAAFDLAMNGRAASHIGRSIIALQHDGTGYAAEMTARKMSMNLGQLKMRQAKLALFGGALLAVLWMIGVQPKLALRLRGTRVGHEWALLAVVIGVLVEMVANDNGVLAGFLLLAPVASAVVLSLTGD